MHPCPLHNMAGLLGDLRVVSNHHDGLAVFATESLQGCQHLLGRFTVEIAGRLVTHQHHRIGLETLVSSAEMAMG